MRKRVSILSSLLALSLLGACSNNEVHEHTFKEEWTTSETHHWKEATCEHTDLTKDLGEHVDLNGDGDCDTCGYHITKRTYCVIWRNYDDSILEIDYEVEEGTIPTCDITPSREDDIYIYNFVGWTPEVTPAYKNVEYKAVIEKDTTEHRVLFLDAEGGILSEQFIATGEYPDTSFDVPQKEATEDKIFEFKGWDKEVSRVYDTVTYTPTYYEYKKTYTTDEYKSMISPTSFGDNFSPEFIYHSGGYDMLLEHVSVANKKLRDLVEGTEHNPFYGNVSDKYEDQENIYYHTIEYGVETNTYIPKNGANQNFEGTLNYIFSSFTNTNANFIYDETTGYHISNGEDNIVYLKFKGGYVNYLKRVRKFDIDIDGNYDTYDELQITSIGGVEPFEIPDYDWQPLEI